jgi:hypothetical protein
MVEDVLRTCSALELKYCRNLYSTRLSPAIRNQTNRILHVLRRKDFSLLFALPTQEFQETSGLSITELSQSSTHVYFDSDTEVLLRRMDYFDYRERGCWKRCIQTRSLLVTLGGTELNLDSILVPYHSLVFVCSRPLLSSLVVSLNRDRKRKLSFNSIQDSNGKCKRLHATPSTVIPCPTDKVLPLQTRVKRALSLNALECPNLTRSMELSRQMNLLTRASNDLIQVSRQ